MIRAGGHAPQISCVKGVDPVDTKVGELYVLDATERATLTAAIDAYNGYIKGKADALGWAYWDPNVPLTALKGTASSRTLPDLTSTTNPFGTAFSLDGVHPSAAGHTIVANGLIAAINAKYGTSLAPLP